MTPKKYLPNQDDANEAMLAAKMHLPTLRPDYPPVPRPTFDGRGGTVAVVGSGWSPTAQQPVKESKKCSECGVEGCECAEGACECK